MAKSKKRAAKKSKPIVKSPSKVVVSENKEPEQLKVEITFGKATAVVRGEKVVFIELDHEECTDNPTTSCDGMGTMYSFSTRHSNYKHPDALPKDEDRVVLSYFEHGQCRWFVKDSDRGYSNMPDFRWDGVSVAGMWYPDKALRDELRGLEGSARRAKLEEFASQCCVIYTDWCNGEVYRWRCETFPVECADDGAVYDQLSDYRFEKALAEEGCGGFYGHDGLKEVVKDIGKFLEEQFSCCKVEVVVNWR